MPSRKSSSSNHSRRHSWPPFSTRHLLGVAPVHFHLNPNGSNSKKRPASSSSNASTSSSFSSSFASRISGGRPPTPQVIVSPPTPPDQPATPLLPDIDDDPFAHFLSPMNDEDNPFDDLAFSAGIIVSDDSATEDEDDVGGEGWEEGKRDDDRLRSKIARRWAKYIAKYQNSSCVGGSGSSSGNRGKRTGGKLEKVDEDEAAEERDEQEDRKRRNDEVAVVDEGYMSEESSGATPVHVKKLQRPSSEPLEPYRTVVREPTRGRAQDLVDGRMRKKRKYRHSWRAPDFDLFTVVEEGEGAVDSEIEQRYFSST